MVKFVLPGSVNFGNNLQGLSKLREYFQIPGLK